MAGTDITEQARRRLRDELEMLRAQRHGLIDGLDDLDTAGDRVDGAETLRRRDEAAMLDDRIAELTRLLAGGQPPGGEQDVRELAPGTRLTLRYPGGSKETLRVVAILEEIAPGEEDRVVTLDSPLGRALAGAEPGDTVEVDTPDGSRLVEIVSSDPPRAG